MSKAGKVVNVALSPEIHRMAKARAALDGVSLGMFVEDAVRRYLRRRAGESRDPMTIVPADGPDRESLSELGAE